MRPALKVLLMSGYTDRDVGTIAGESEGMAFMQKPFTPDVLTRRVSELLGTTEMNSAQLVGGDVESSDKIR